MSSASIMTERHFFVGAYTESHERGMARLSFDATTGWRLGAKETDIESASFAVKDERRGLHYIINECDSGTVSAYQRTKEGSWLQICEAPSGGAMPCHVTLHPSGAALAVANYRGGEIALHRIAPDGTFQGPPMVACNQGSGPNRERQSGPHAHCVRFADSYLYSTDLGSDEILCRTYDADNHTLGARMTAFRLPAGQGPRHLLFHPGLPLAYALTEMGSELFVLERQTQGRLQEVQRIANLPAGFEGKSLGGHLEISAKGDRLYASNRGHDSIASYAIEDGGRLKLLRMSPSGGAYPRHFQVCETINAAIVSNEKGNNVAVLGLGTDRAIGGVLCSLPVSRPAFIGVC
jgi:6-phosphogluconolactonase